MPHQSGFTVTNGFSVGPDTGGQAVEHNTPIQINDDISWVKGNHQINFGAGGEVSKMLFDGNVYSQTNWTFPNMASFLLGQFSANSLSLPNNLNLQKWFVNSYIQDTWKVNSRFTVNAGLRWEPFLPPSNLSGSVYNFSMANLISGVKSTQFNNAPPGLLFPGDPGINGKQGENSEWALFAPRVALAWDPKGDGKTVFRASWGIAYDYNAGELTVNAADAPPYGGTEIWSGTFSNPYATTIPAATFSPMWPTAPMLRLPSSGIYIALQPNLKTTSVNQWNAVAQHQFGRDWLVSATYMGSEAAHLWIRIRRIPPSIFPEPAPRASMASRSPAPAPPLVTRTIAGYSLWPVIPALCRRKVRRYTGTWTCSTAEGHRATTACFWRCRSA